MMMTTDDVSQEQIKLYIKGLSEISAASVV